MPSGVILVKLTRDLLWPITFCQGHSTGALHPQQWCQLSIDSTEPEFSHGVCMGSLAVKGQRWGLSAPSWPLERQKQEYGRRERGWGDHLAVTPPGHSRSQHRDKKLRRCLGYGPQLTTGRGCWQASNCGSPCFVHVLPSCTGAVTLLLHAKGLPLIWQCHCRWWQLIVPLCIKSCPPGKSVPE